MKYWPQEAYKWYRNACAQYDYPAWPYGKALKALIASTDTVLDLGCGIGMASLMISPWCRQVIALDQDETALHWLEESARERNLLNIETVHQCWPPLEPIRADVIVALHVYGAMRLPENLKAVFTSAHKGGFIACDAPCSRDEEPFVELKEELGTKLNYQNCDNGCYTKAVMETLGARVQCAKVVYEFGQPLDTIGEVARFICWQSGVLPDKAHMVAKYADRYALKKDGGYLIPITRQSCGITFLKP
ncbi:MAG: class I SAM-dependent methyltransferase [Dehalococcoidia bacterium]|nr:class I SAM-dependent methyltransferase [Dehalococcoidia bacterium]